MTITALITTRNRSGMLREAIDSVLGQEPSDDATLAELIVVDDDSSDDTPAVVASYPDVRYIRTKQGTAAGSRNVGIAAATGEWMAFLDDDDVWLPAKLRACGAVVRARPDVALVCTAAVLCDEGLNRTGGSWSAPDPADYGGSAFDAYLERVMTPSTVMVRRDVFDRIGLFDPGEPRIEDRDMWLRIARHGFTCAAVQEPLALYRVRDNPNGQMLYDDYRGTMRVVNRHLTEAGDLRPGWLRRQRVLWGLRGWYCHQLLSAAREHARRREADQARRFSRLAFSASPVHYLKGTLLPGGSGGGS
ncbi:MAG TPA: glycosyltransferase family A protein [Armatimonadaceae bacterium]|nr:glycosyltransferase family A protein [Armatimonadaceae bacterium]